MSSQQGILGTIRPSSQIGEDDMGDIQYLARIANGELTGGTLVMLKGTSNTTQILGTVPALKDWYLMNGSMVAVGVANGNISVEYPTSGDVVMEINNGQTTSQTSVVATGIGKKITAAQTITITKAGAATSTVTLLEILEMDVGVSPKLT